MESWFSLRTLSSYPSIHCVHITTQNLVVREDLFTCTKMFRHNRRRGRHNLMFSQPCRLRIKFTGMLPYVDWLKNYGRFGETAILSSGSNGSTHSSGTLVTTHQGMVSKKTWTATMNSKQQLRVKFMRFVFLLLPFTVQKNLYFFIYLLLFSSRFSRDTTPLYITIIAKAYFRKENLKMY
jgi:hypothetical protein